MYRVKLSIGTKLLLTKPRLLSALFYCLLACFSLSANSAEPIDISVDDLNTIPIVLTNEQVNYSFAGKVAFFEDKSGTLVLADIQEKFSQNAFKLIKEDNLSLGYIKSTIWLKFTVQNLSSNSDDWLLLFDYPLLDEIEVYEKNGRVGSNTWDKVLMGDSFLFKQRPLDYRLFATPLKLENVVQREFYVRVSSASSMQLRLSIVASGTFFVEELGNEMFYGLIYGIMLLMAIYNLFLYLAVRDKSYLAYVFSVLSGCVFVMALNGHAYQYLWPEMPTLANTAIPLFTSLWMTSTGVFTQIFLETRKFAPRLYYAINVMIIFALFSVLFSLLGEYQTAIKMATGLALLNGILLLSTSIVCWRSGNRSARFFVAAWIIFGMGMGMLVISRFGIIPDNFVTHNSASLGLLVEIIMLSLALSDKYRVLQEELEQHTVELEHKVAQRTQELEISNLKLRDLSRNDSLTGLPNRRYFDQQLEQEWDRAQRESKELSILVCDIDEFKKINDHFGHQYGDDCLKAFANVLRSSASRTTDLPARYGGDEFVIILPGTGAAGAEQLGKYICEKVQQLALKQAPEAAHAIVTVTIGSATLVPGPENNIKQFFSLADKNLFKAKKSGRNAVLSA